MLIRELRESDAEQFLRLRSKLDRETKFMLLEPKERDASIEFQRKQIQAHLARDNATSFVAEHDGELVGYLGAEGGKFKRNRHSAHIVIGILQAFTGQGIGTQLFIELERWARQKSITRLELTVMVHNAAGVALYKKRGFEIEGLLRHALIIDDQYVDEYCMAKLLN